MRKKLIISFDDGAKVETLVDDGTGEGKSVFHCLNAKEPIESDCCDYYSNIDILSDMFIRTAIDNEVES